MSKIDHDKLLKKAIEIKENMSSQEQIEYMSRPCKLREWKDGEFNLYDDPVLQRIYGELITKEESVSK